MNRKYFPFDKNYLLKEAQANSQETLLCELVEIAISQYQAIHNPLGLVDTTIVRLQQYEPGKLHLFHEFYEDLAGIYRYKYGEVQLEFLWDGTPHHIKYQKEWEETFKTWIADFSAHQTFTRAIFELTVFRTDLTRPELAQSRLKTFLVNHFDLKLYQYKGIRERSDVA